MKLGAFSVSLTVKDLAASLDFYTKLGFEALGGDAAQGWLILRNGSTTIGLFRGMFDKNMLTFNPGWSDDATPLEDFADIRDIQKQLKSNGVVFATEADETTTGPTHLIVSDPDGNLIMLDQHV